MVLRHLGERGSACVLAAFVLALMLPAGQARACGWLGNGDNWFDGANWDSCLSAVPTPADDISIDGSVPVSPVVGAGGSAQSRNLFIRYGGVLTINGTLESGAGLIADLDEPSYATTVSVEGDGALWTLGDFLSVGREGLGVLDIADGGAVSNSGDGYVGEAAGSEGEVTVDGAGSRWTNSDRLLVGVQGAGTLNISNGAEVTDGTEGIVGDQAFGVGAVTVDDASWVSDGLLYVGNYGIGRLEVVNGGSVSNTYGTAGFYADSSGEIDVDGSGSTWRNSAEINIGNHGNGVLDITGGGLVTGDTASRIGNYADGVGAATVSGAGSLWSNAGTLYVGREGKGALTLSDGGEVDVGSGDGTLVVAANAGSTGTVNIGAAADDDPVAPGTLTAGSLLFGDGDGTLVFNHTGAEGDYTFSADIAGDGTIRQLAGSTRFTGDGSAFTGTLAVGDGNFDIQGELGGDVRVDHGASITIDVAIERHDLPIAGSGDIFKTGSGALDLTKVSGANIDFDGNAFGLGGILFLDIGGLNQIHIGGCGAYGGIVDGEVVVPPEACFLPPSPSVFFPGIEATACLGGLPTIGDLFIYRDGCVSPGHSVGTVHVTDSWEMQDGAIYVVELKGGGTTPGVHSDLVEVDGTAVLKDGTRIHVIPENRSDDGASGYADGSRYAIIRAGTLNVEGSVEISDAYAYLDFAGDHDAHNYYLVSSLISDSFTLDGMTRNQKATADAAFALGAGHAVYDQILNMNEADARAAMDALSGEVHASLGTALIEDSRLVRDAVDERIRAAFGAAGSAAFPVLAYGPDARPAPVAADDAGPVFWAHAFGAWGATGSDGNAARLKRSTGGMLVGADAMAGDWRLGVLAGYSHANFDVGDRASSASSNNYHLGVYAGTQLGHVGLRGGAAYSFHRIRTGRFVTSPGLQQTLTSDYDAGTFQAFGELGYDIDLASGARVEPFANLAHVNLSTDSFAEQGGTAALSGRAGSSDVTFATLGIRAEHDLQFGTVDARLRGMVGWRHAFGDTTPESVHAFAGGGDFTIAGVPVAKDSAVIEAGLETTVASGTTLGLSYSGQIASGAYDHGFNANLAVSF